ncbi:hypothetical protein LTR70_002055 [Exophiala xenobiotica]|uniref:Transcription initiation factor TFIID subunit 13 n=1 Tax=Lithohypha guttulata TaxID=1690604 RepID=A0ABR0KBY7_9EURO|nr:hypothetical protein LTR24_004620 [Lithohypha guttulata]KAK5326291.1 hypothetical protein LTR70_002055 [Exophiala xenobiotica]
MEPRARAARHKSTLNFSEDLIDLLHGSGAPTHPDLTHPLPDGSSRRYLTTLPTDNRSHLPTPFSKPQSHGTDPTTATSTPRPTPYPETLRVLDEMVTDYIIETSHNALQTATYAGRAKLKLPDFEWVLRRDRKKLGRAQEMRRKMKRIAEEKKGADEGVDPRRMAVKELQDLGDIVGEEGTGKGKGKGRGRRRKRNAEEAGLQVPTMAGAIRSESGGANGHGVNGNGDADDLGDVDVDVDNDLEDAREEEDKHKNKRARSEANSRS